MYTDKSVLSIKDYGKIHIHLQDLLEQRGMNRNELARMINTRFEVVNKWYHDDVSKIDADILARICYVLNCNIDDILSYSMVETGADS